MPRILAARARARADQPFIRAGAQSLSYREFDAASARLARLLLAHGVARGDPVVLYLPSVPVLAVAYHACQRIAAVPVPVGRIYQERELGVVLVRTDARVLLTERAAAEVVGRVRPVAPALECVVGLDGPGDGIDDGPQALERMPDSLEPAGLDGDEVAALFFTSGTTGEPKGAMQTHANIYFAVRDTESHFGFRHGREVLLCVLPLFNNFGATVLLAGALYNGGTLVLRERWDTLGVLDDIEREGVTFVAGTPTMYSYLLAECERSQRDLSSLRIAVAGGAPLAPHLVERFERVTGVPLLQIYGATEVCTGVVAESPHGARRAGSTGHPIGATRIDVVGDDGGVLAPGEVGEIRIDGDTVGPGYWRDPQGTRAAFTAQGWLSGDVGHVDDDGFVYVHDRKKDVILCGGFNVYPLEVEDVIYEIEEVELCALIGLGDERLGERPVAYVQRRAGASLAADAVIAHCRRRLAHYKAPREVRFVDAFPLGPTGKILKRALRARETGEAPS